MRWDARGTIALLVSALVGLTARAVVGLHHRHLPRLRRRDARPGGRVVRASPDDPQLGAITVRPPGLVEIKTWRMLRDRACLRYDF